MMRYSKEIVNQIKIIDEVLYSLNLPSILKNEYLVTDAINCENYLKLHYNKPNNTRNIPTYNIWQLPQNLSTSRFYKDFYERFVKIGDSPKIILVYIPDKDYIMSNSSFFKTAIYVYRGINEDDFNKKGPEYKHYLNSMFLLSECLKN